MIFISFVVALGLLSLNYNAGKMEKDEEHLPANASFFLVNPNENPNKTAIAFREKFVRHIILKIFILKVLKVMNKKLKKRVLK